MTLVSVFTVSPEKQSVLADLLVDATEETLPQLPGFIFASFQTEYGRDEVDLEGWRERLQLHRVSIEEETVWPRGGTSLYFRDPDGHLVELATPGLWAIY